MAKYQWEEFTDLTSVAKYSFGGHSIVFHVKDDYLITCYGKIKNQLDNYRSNCHYYSKYQ